jgi:hypothetical protein
VRARNQFPISSVNRNSTNTQINVQMNTSRILSKLLVIALASLVAVAASADTVYNNFTGYSDFWHPFGFPDTSTYGELFTAPSSADTNLQDFGFYMGSTFTEGDIKLQAYIATWTGTQAGTLVFSSPVFDYANTGNDFITFNTGGLPLTPGGSYVAFLSISEQYGNSVGQAYVSQGSEAIPGGAFVYYNNGGDFSLLFSNPWDAQGLKPDWAFNATFTSGSSCAWSNGPDLPSAAVRSVGVYFPANGKFYAVGGRSSDSAGSDFIHPFEYDPGTNTWTTKSATYPDNQVNNMACGVLNDSGTDYIYCVGGSAAGGSTATDRVFRYNPVTDVISTVAAPWPGDVGGTILPGGFSVFQNNLYVLGGFSINVNMVDDIWQFDPAGLTWTHKAAHLPVALGYVPTCTIGSLIYTGGGSTWDGSTIHDSTNSFAYDPVADSISTIASIPRATGETRALNFNNQMRVMGGGRDAPNPSNEVDVYDPTSNVWSTDLPFTTARRNFPTDTDGSTNIWLAGGYDSSNTNPLASMEIFQCGGGGGGITLTATVKHHRGNSRVNLSWSPADGGDVNVLRNGKVVFTTADDGSASNNLGSRTGTVSYQVCETDSGDCSNVVDVSLR